MFAKQLQKYFFIVVVLASILLVYLWYKDYSFSSSPLEEKYQLSILKKQQELKILAYRNFQIKKDFPLIISDKMSARRFGMTTYDRNKNIIIYLNKKRFKESSNYMINDVLPHEYAHAIMFYFKDFTNENSGHSKRWQNICRKLNGLRCDRFVNHEDILIEKTNPFK